MDIPRPELATQRKRRRVAFLLVCLAATAAVSVGLARLKPAAPEVDRASIWMDEVKRGEMLRQVRGSGSLVPEQIQYVQSDTDGRIERIEVLAGAIVQADTLLMKLSNPELEQSVFDLEWQLKAQEAQLTKLQVRLESERLTQQASSATLKADAEYAELEAQVNESLARDGLAAQMEAKRFRLRANDLQSRHQMELKRLDIGKKSAAAEIAVQEADLEKLRASLEMKRKKVLGLHVRAGVEGVLQQVGDKEPLQVGQRISPSTTLAKIVQPTKLKAEIKVAETQMKDVLIGQVAWIDTHNGIIPGRVARIDPAVQNSTVTVDITLEGTLPKGARPDLSIDGTIELERLNDVLFVGRPVHGQAESSVTIFRVGPDGKEASRVAVKFGRSSVSTIEIREGLNVGDQVILSDMSQWDEHERVRLN